MGKVHISINFLLLTFLVEDGWLREGEGCQREEDGWLREGDGWLSEGDGWLREGEGGLSEGDGWLREGDEWPNTV